ncbi:MAG: transposase [Burkholderia sp.]|nr:transposase [Burkholderia sp.]
MRREFIKALDAIPKAQRHQALAAWPVERIAGLYRIERQFADATPEQRRLARQKFSLPVMNDIRAWLERHQAQVLPKSLLGKAFGYALAQWDRVMVYLDDGRLSIDNNIAERAIKDLVLGRKAWLFADRPEGAHTIAAMHSLVQTAVANGLDPYRYLEHVFETMPQLSTSQELEQLLPWNVVLPRQRAPAELVA